MMSPGWLFDILVALTLIVAAVSATRLATAPWPADWLLVARPGRSRSSPRHSGGPDIDIAYLLMCIAMAGMLAPSVKTLPSQTWEAIFGLLTAWFAWRMVEGTRVDGLRSLVRGHHAVHLFHCVATVYMFAALTTADSMDKSGMGRAMAPSLTYAAPARAFALVLACHSVWDFLAQLSGRRSNLGRAPSSGAALACDTTSMVACRIGMGASMALMLITS